MFNIYLGIYIIVAIFATLGGSYKLHTQPIAAVIFFIGVLIVFIIFGLKWFGDKGALSKTPVSWPPVMNTCPDYLVYYGRKTPDGVQDTCIDTIGVSKNRSLEVFPKGSPPSDDKYYFPLATKNSDPAARQAELCSRTITYGLTWEGITNGESCLTSGSVAPVAPVAPSDTCPESCTN